MDATELRMALAGFTGSDTFIRHPLTSRVLMTEGAVFLAEQAQAWWLTDAIVSYLTDPRAKREEFQVWRLRVDTTKRSATLTMTDGNSDTPIVTQAIDYTDFLLDEVALWLVRGGPTWTLMLPTEY